MQSRALHALMLTATLSFMPAAVRPNLDSPGILADEVAFASVVPVPASSVTAPGVIHFITTNTAIFADSGATGIADYLAQKLRASTGYTLPVSAAPGPGGGIQLLLT